MRPLLLDLFCGEGGAAVGYHRAGFDIIGVDIVEQPRYPFRFVRGDAIACCLAFASAFDAIHASPPCQAFSMASLYHPGTQAKHPNLIEPTRAALVASGLPFVIENVAGAPIRKDLMLCGEQFGLRVHRHRYFEVNWPAVRTPHAKHRLKGAAHNCHIEDGHARLVAGNYANHEDASDAMGVDWMTRRGLAESIPPAYTQHIGAQLLEHLRARTEAVAA